MASTRRRKASEPPAAELLSDWALVAVFSQLPDLASVVRCSCVCSRWRRLVVAHAQLWARHTLEITDSRRCDAPRCVSSIDLTRICFAERVSVCRAVATLFEGGDDRPQLVSVTLGSVEPRVFSCVLAYAPCLRELRASIDERHIRKGCWTSTYRKIPRKSSTSAGVSLREAFAARGARCASVLEVLELCNDVLDLPPLPSLRSLLLGYGDTERFTLHDTSSLASGCPLLESVHVQLGDADLAAVAGLQHLVSLGTLELDSLDHLDVLATSPCARTLSRIAIAVRSVADALAKLQVLPGLRGLQLCRIKSLPRDVAEVPGVLPVCNLPVLQSLHITGHVVNDWELAMVASLPALEELHLDKLSLSTAVLPILASGRCAAVLRKITISSCNLSSAGTGSASPGRSRFESLQVIVVRYCSMSSELLCSFAECSPKLSVVRVCGSLTLFENLRERLLQRAPTLVEIEVPTRERWWL
eukprot:m51a1_g14729 hypothetical protein (473) ;mRNA; r:222244-223741